MSFALDLFLLIFVTTIFVGLMWWARPPSVDQLRAENKARRLEQFKRDSVRKDGEENLPAWVVRTRRHMERNERGSSNGQIK